MKVCNKIIPDGKSMEDDYLIEAQKAVDMVHIQN